MNIEQAAVMFVLMLVAQIPILITAFVAFLKNRAAIDANTKLTKVAAEDLSKAFNGELDTRIKVIVSEAVDPLRDELKIHAAHMGEIRIILQKITV